MATKKKKTPAPPKKTAKAAPTAGAPVDSGLGAAIAESLAVGYRPSGQLHPQDEELFRAFQSNLLSLISHELRTPLTGVLNALSVLDSDGGSGGMSSRELVSMARRNAQRLHQVLTTLLDLGAVESGTFHARLREVDLLRVVRTRLDANAQAFHEAQVEVELVSAISSLVLADPQKLGRAIDLCFQAIAGRVLPKSKITLRALASRVEIQFVLRPESQELWQNSWSQAIAGFKGGLGSPGSAFASSAFGGVLQSEKAFLSRTEEGLGSEFLVIHTIMQLHGGKLLEEHGDNQVTLSLEFSELSSEDALRAVLMSRAYAVSHELGSVALVLIRIPEGADSNSFSEKVRTSLFRATDAVYAIPERAQIALVLDDCKPADSLRVMKRLEREIGQSMKFGIAHCPSDGAEPARLFDIATDRINA